MSAGFRFRSPFLKALPDTHKGVSAQLLAHRWSVFAGVVGALALLLVAIAQRWFALDGWFSWIYWLHDKLYLPLKGYTFSLFFPFSLIWWGLIVLALGLGLISYLGVRASWRVPHVWATRFLLENSGVHGWLLGVAAAMGRRGADLTALSLICRDVWQEALLACRRRERGVSELWPFQQAVSLAGFALRLEQLRQAEVQGDKAASEVQTTHAPSAAILNFWLATYLEVERCAQGSSHRQYYLDLLKDLARQLKPLLPPLEHDEASQDVFSLATLGADMQALLMVTHAELAQGSKRFAKLAAGRRAKVLLERAARHHQQRLQLLVSQARTWESYAFNLGGVAQNGSEDTAAEDHERGCLATWVAFLLAAVSHKVYMVEAWMDGLDMLALYHGQQPAPGMPNLDELPTLAQFQLLQRMQDHERQRSQQAWKKTPFKDLLMAQIEVDTPQMRLNQLAVQPDGEA